MARHKDTVAITITLPRALHEAVKELAKRRDCGNISAVVRASLYREAGLSTDTIAVDRSAAAQIKEAEARTVKYGRKRARQAAEQAVNSGEVSRHRAVLRKAAKGEGGGRVG